MLPVPPSPSAGLPRVSPRRRSAARQRAFTVLELMLVISLIAILASITLVVGREITERSKVAQAKAEMAVLAAALEQYKQQYGDYPWTPYPLPFAAQLADQPPVHEDWDGAVMMFNALCGNVGPRGTQFPDRNDDGEADKGRSFIELSRFNLWFSDKYLPDPEKADVVNNWFADPWGKAYYYHYRKVAPGTAGDTWKSKGFLLYSHGPDEDCNVGPAGDSGFLDEVPDEPKNRDNIYHGRD